MYLSWDGYQERTEKEAYKEKTEKPMSLPVTLQTCLLNVQQLSIFKFISYFIKISGEPLETGARLRYYKLS